MSDYPGERPDDDQTRPLGWQQPSPPRGWDAPDARPQSWDAPPAEQPSGQSPYGQSSYGQSSYGPQDSQGHGTPAPGSGPPGMVPYGVALADHPSANLALVLGIVGLVGGLTCGIGFLVSPFAWVVGRNALREIRESGGHYGGEGSARAGQVLGIIGTVLLALAVLAVVALVAFFVLAAGAADLGSGGGNV